MSKAKKEVTQETAERVKDKVVKAIAEEVKIIQETVEDVKKEIAQNSLDEPVDDYMAPESIGIRKGDYQKAPGGRRGRGGEKPRERRHLHRPHTGADGAVLLERKPA